MTGSRRPTDGADPEELLFAPVRAGYWRQHEIWDGTYTLDDLLDILNVMSSCPEYQR